MPRGRPGIPVSSSQKTTSMPAPEAAWGVACAQRAARGQGILVAGLLGRPRPLRVLTATSQRDLSFSRALGELQLRARPACSEHPLRVRRQRRPSGPEPGPESGSPRERGGSWPSCRSPGERVWETLRTPRQPSSALGVVHPSRLSPAGGAEARTASGSLAGGRQHMGASRAPVSTLRGPEVSAGASARCQL